jgi:hypothetical protein
MAVPEINAEHSSEVKKQRYSGHSHKPGHRELGQPVRNTNKSGLRPNTEEVRTNRGRIRNTAVPKGSHTATPNKNRMHMVLAARV